MAQQRYYASTAKQASLASSVDSITTSITLDLVTGFPSSFPYTLALDPDTNKEELVLVTAGAGTILTVVRGQDGTANVAHTTGATVRHVASGQDFNQFSAHIGSTSTPTASGVHGVTGSVVGTTDTQSLSNKTLASTKRIGIDTATGTAVASAGDIAWNTSRGTMDIQLNSNVILQVGQEEHVYVRNTTGSTIQDMTFVMVTGVHPASGTPTVAPAVTNGSIDAMYMLGITTEDIANNGYGYVTVRGEITTNTSAYTEGGVLYNNPSVAGGLSHTAPTAPNLKLPIAFVTYKHNTQGKVMVRMTNGSALGGTDSNVQITAPSNGQILKYNSSTGVWVNDTLDSTDMGDFAEAVQDVAGAELVNGSHNGVVATYDDAAGTIGLSIAGHTGSSAVHGATGAVVGTTNTQTLTNKTLSDPILSGTMTGGTLSGQTHTNATLGSNLAAGSYKITGLADPSSAQDAATKTYADARETAAKSYADSTFIPSTQKGAANGVATLGADSKIPAAQIPDIAITSTSVVASQSAMLALTAQVGDVAVRTDLNKSFILKAEPASTLANWQELLTPTDTVLSVDGRTGAVTLSDLYDAAGAAASKLPLAGGTMAGAIAMGTNKITGMGTPTASTDAATKGYVDTVTVAPSNLTGVITSVGNVTSIASQTGTGTKFVVDTSPTLVTPNIGVATATSINGTSIPSSKTLVVTTDTSLLVPTQTGNSGKYLTTDGTNASWSTVNSLPSQTGNAGKYLTTDGSTASWASVTTDPTADIFMMMGA